MWLPIQYNISMRNLITNSVCSKCMKFSLEAVPYPCFLCRIFWISRPSRGMKAGGPALSQITARARPSLSLALAWNFCCRAAVRPPPPPPPKKKKLPFLSLTPPATVAAKQQSPNVSPPLPPECLWLSLTTSAAGRKAVRHCNRPPPPPPPPQMPSMSLAALPCNHSCQPVAVPDCQPPTLPSLCLALPLQLACRPQC